MKQMEQIQNIQKEIDNLAKYRQDSKYFIKNKFIMLCSFGDLKKVKSTLQEEKMNKIQLERVINYKETATGKTAFYTACYFGHLNIVQELLYFGVDINKS